MRVLLSSILFWLLTPCNSQDYLISFIDTSSGQVLYGYKNVKRKIIIPAKYNLVDTDTLHHIAFVVGDSGFVVINRKDSILCHPFVFDNTPDFIHEGMFRFEENNKIGFANLKGEKVAPASFDFAEPFSEGLAAFNTGGRKEYLHMDEHYKWAGGLWGFINKKGTIVIKPTFTNVGDFKNKKAEVETKEGKRFLINTKGFILKELPTIGNSKNRLERWY